MKVRAGLVATAVAGGLALTACGVGTTNYASGLQDDTKHVTAQYKVKTRTVIDYRKQCVNKKKRVKHTSGTGTKQRTWYTWESYKDCKNVRSGSHTEQYRVKTRSEKYCVELDRYKDDDGDYNNDVWFTVSGSEYMKAVARSEGDKVKKMEYSYRGC